MKLNYKLNKTFFSSFWQKSLSFICLLLISLTSQQGEDCSNKAILPHFYGVYEGVNYLSESKKSTYFDDIFYHERLEYFIVATNSKIDHRVSKYGYGDPNMLQYDQTQGVPGLQFYPAVQGNFLPQYFLLDLQGKAQIRSVSCFVSDVNTNGEDISPAVIQQTIKAEMGANKYQVGDSLCTGLLIYGNDRYTLVHFRVRKESTTTHHQHIDNQMPISVKVVKHKTIGEVGGIAEHARYSGQLLSVVHEYNADGNVRFLNFSLLSYKASVGSTQYAKLLISSFEEDSSYLENYSATEQVQHVGVVPTDVPTHFKLIYTFSREGTITPKIIFRLYELSTIPISSGSNLIGIDAAYPHKAVEYTWSGLSSATNVICSTYAGINPSIGEKMILFGVQGDVLSSEPSLFLIDRTGTANFSFIFGYNSVIFSWTITSIVCDQQTFGKCTLLFMASDPTQTPVGDKYFIASTHYDANVVGNLKVAQTRSLSTILGQPYYNFRASNFRSSGEINEPVFIFNLPQIVFNKNPAPEPLNFQNPASLISSAHASGCNSLLDWKVETVMTLEQYVTPQYVANIVNTNNQLEQNFVTTAQQPPILEARQLLFSAASPYPKLTLPTFNCQSFTSVKFAAFGIGAKEELHCFLAGQQNLRPLSPVNMPCSEFVVKYQRVEVEENRYCRDIVQRETLRFSFKNRKTGLDLTNLRFQESTSVDCELLSRDDCLASNFLVQVYFRQMTIQNSFDPEFLLIKSGNIDSEKYKGVEIEIQVAFMGQSHSMTLAPFYLVIGKDFPTDNPDDNSNTEEGSQQNSNLTDQSSTNERFDSENGQVDHGDSTGQSKSNDDSRINSIANRTESAEQNTQNNAQEGQQQNIVKLIAGSQSDTAASTGTANRDQTKQGLIKKQMRRLIEDLSQVLRQGRPQNVEIVQQMTDEDQIPATQIQFNFIQWAELHGVPLEEIQQKSWQVGNKMMTESMKREYVVPLCNQISQIGIIQIRFSSPILKPSAEMLYTNLLQKSDNERSRRMMQGNGETIKDEIREIIVPVSFTENDKIEAIFKAGALLNAKLIPGTDQHIDKKNFKWRILEYTNDSLKLQVEFENPDYVSMGEHPDQLQIMFNNTKAFLEPKDQNLISIPNEYELVLIIPPQRKEQLSTLVEDANVKENIQGFVLSQFILAFFLNFSLQQVFGAMLAFQILAYIPLLDVSLPGEAYIFFEILSPIVTFDYFPLFDYIDGGFLTTEPYSPGFQLLDFQSLNFAENIGSILFIGLGLILYSLIALLVNLVRIQAQSRVLRRNLEMIRVKQSQVGFMYGICFDVMITATLALISLKFMPLFQLSDHISTLTMILFVMGLGLLVSLVIYFAVVLVKKIHAKEKGIQIVKHAETLKSLKENFETKVKQFRSEKQMSTTSGLMSGTNFSTGNKTSFLDTKKLQIISEDISADQSQISMRALEQLEMEEKTYVEKSKTFKDLDIRLYEPMVGKLRQNSRFALTFPVIFLFRRLSIVFIIFTLKGQADLQMLAFMVITLLKCTYQAHAYPFQEKWDNRTELFTEICFLQCSILLMIQLIYPVGYTRSFAGFLLVSIALLNVVTIFVITLINTIIFLKRKAKEFCVKYRHAKSLKTHKEKKDKAEKIKQKGNLGGLKEEKNQKKLKTMTPISKQTERFNFHESLQKLDADVEEYQQSVIEDCEKWEIERSENQSEKQQSLSVRSQKPQSKLLLHRNSPRDTKSQKNLSQNFDLSNYYERMQDNFIPEINRKLHADFESQSQKSHQSLNHPKSNFSQLSVSKGSSKLSKRKEPYLQDEDLEATELVVRLGMMQLPDPEELTQQYIEQIERERNYCERQKVAKQGGEISAAVMQQSQCILEEISCDQEEFGNVRINILSISEKSNYEN